MVADAKIYDIHDHPDYSLEMQLDRALASRKAKGINIYLKAKL